MYLRQVLLPFKQFATLIGCLLVVYSLCRLSFYAINAAHFNDLAGADLLRVLWNGVRYDVSALTVINSLYLIFILSPFYNIQSKFHYRILNTFFVFFNGIPLLFEITDWVYFKFNHKRSTFEVMQMLFRKGDFMLLLPTFFKDFWFLFLLGIGLFILLYFIHKQVATHFFKKSKALVMLPKYNYKTVLGKLAILVVTAGAAILGIRGGMQYVPINIRNAIEVTTAKNTALVLNTPFSIINTIQGVNRLTPLNFMPLSQAESLIPPVKQFATTTFKPKNVVVIIVEGLSKEFTQLGSGKSYTPFLDSLMNCSLTFTNAYANGLRSIEGIPAILAGIPALMDDAFITSTYSNNQINSIASVLKAEGYSTAFFHGANNGSMSFDVFTKAAGFDKYYGRREYSNEQDFDGTWGIFDEPFLQYFGTTLSKMKQPFVGSVFTVSSHHPFPIPDQFINKFPKGDLAPHESIGYTDYALKRFFDHAKTQNWFEHTLFVITADHCSPFASNEFYSAGAGRLAIPLIYYCPGDVTLSGYNNTITQQIDILPTTLAYLGYGKPFFALGSNALDSAEYHFAGTSLSDVVDFLDANYRIKYTNNQLIEAYAYPQDSLGKNNLVNDPLQLPLINNTLLHMKAFYQNFNNAVLNDKMYVRQK